MRKGFTEAGAVSAHLHLSDAAVAESRPASLARRLVALSFALVYLIAAPLLLVQNAAADGGTGDQGVVTKGSSGSGSGSEDDEGDGDGDGDNEDGDSDAGTSAKGSESRGTTGGEESTGNQDGDNEDGENDPGTSARGEESRGTTGGEDSTVK